MPFNCSIKTTEAKRADGSKFTLVTVSGPPHSGKSKVADMIGRYFVSTVGSSKVACFTDHTTPEREPDERVDVVIRAKQAPRGH